MGIYLCLLFIIGVPETNGRVQYAPTGITQTLKYTAVGTSLLAITADGFVEYYYQKYREEDSPSWCAKYRERTQLCEKIRDISIWGAGLSFVGYVILEKTGQKSKTQGFLNKLDFKFTDKKVGTQRAVSLQIHYEI